MARKKREPTDVPARERDVSLVRISGKMCKVYRDWPENPGARYRAVPELFGDAREMWPQIKPRLADGARVLMMTYGTASDLTDADWAWLEGRNVAA